MLEAARAFLVCERDGEEAAAAELTSVADRYKPYGTVQSCVADVRNELGLGAAAASANGQTFRTRLGAARRRLGAALPRGW
jgi:hypothetical protein